ncbi:hypothetical protein [Streptomyces sp. C10]|uniref:hypothetical protein n=1 Tax=Streptomyces sp. C10 TaxID=531941 RepID=UPI00397F9921
MSLATTTLRRGRRLAVASLVAVAALSLTACQNGDDKASPAPSASSSQVAPDGGSKAGDSTSGGSASGGSASGGAPSGGSSAGGSSAGSSSTGGQQAGGGSGAATGKGASRTGANGGQGSATGGPGYGTLPCTLADLRKAAKLGNVTVRVSVDHGAATQIVERYHP